ncbi:MAG: sugar-binding domain-containing protein [Geminicoccaceae bacterium]
MTAAAYLEGILAQKSPQTLGFSTGRTLKAMVEEVAPMDRRDHRIVTTVGTMTEDGRASPYDVAMRLAARIGASCYPMPTPVVAGSRRERELLQTQRAYDSVRRIAGEAHMHFVGIGEIGWGCPMHADGFLSNRDLSELLDAGAVGEIASWPFDRDGEPIQNELTQRLAGLPIDRSPDVTRIGVAGGGRKVEAIHAALRGRLITGLITDEITAGLILEREEVITRTRDGLDNRDAAAE